MQRSDHRMKRRAFLIMAATGLLASSSRLQSSTFTGTTMGTTYSVVIREPLSSASKAHLQATIDDALGSVVASMSTYEPDSELSKFNASSSTQWQSLSPDLFYVLQAASRASQLTGGAFDVTLGPLIDLWGFGPGLRSPAPPHASRLERTREQVGHSLLYLDQPLKRARKQDARLRLDLSSIAKGYAVDKISALLESHGFGSHLVEIGGDVRVRSRKAERNPWRLAVESPGPAHWRKTGIVELGNGGIATSGNDRDFFDHGNRRYPHVLDPASGEPVDHPPMSVTVAAATSMEADALATALLVMGPARGYRFATEHGLAASFVETTGAAGGKWHRTRNTMSMPALIEA